MNLSPKVDSKIIFWVEKIQEKYVPSSRYAIWNHKNNGLYNIKRHNKNINDSIFYLIMTHEVTDCGNKVQFAICSKSVDIGFDVHENFIGIYNLDKIKAETLVTVVKNVFIKLNLPSLNARGQCYDGTNNMCVIKSGVSNEVLLENP